MATFCCSIETEPKTLSVEQLSLAREVAVDIVQKKEASEASSIFVDGMEEPIVTIKEMQQTTVQRRDSVYNLDDSTHRKDQKKEINGTTCQCTLTSAVIDSTPDQSKLKEPLSAPF